MRRTYRIGLGVAILLAIGGWFFGLWLPAHHSSENAKWQAAGERALDEVALPAQFQASNDAGARVGHCEDAPTIRCFVAANDPSDNVAAVKTAVAGIATGPITTMCVPTLLPNNPPRTCSLTVPVSGSKLAINLFSHSATEDHTTGVWSYTGTYVEAHLGPR